MIGGLVNARCEAVVRLQVRGPAGAELHLDAVVDSRLHRPCVGGADD